MDLRRLLAFLTRWGLLLLAGTMLAGGTAFAVASATSETSRYESTAVLLVGPALTAADANSGQLDASRRVSAVYVMVATSRPVLQRVIDQLALDTSIEGLRGQLTVSTPQEPPIITISAQADGSELAAALANEVARQLIATSPALGSGELQTDQFIERQIGALQEEIESLAMEVERLAVVEPRTPQQNEQLIRLQDRLANLRGTYAALVAASSSTASTLLTFIEEAVPYPAPLSRGHLQITIFAAMIGLVLAVALAVVVEQLDDTIKSSEDVNTAAEWENLGEIPRIPSQLRRNPSTLTGQLWRHPAINDSFHALRTAIELSARTSIKSILVTSTGRGEGKTTVAVMLSVAFAQAGRRVLLVDADLRRPSVHDWFGCDNSQGLSDLLRSSAVDVSQYLQPTPPGSSTQAVDVAFAAGTAVTNLWVLTAGPLVVDAAGLVGSTKTTELLRDLGQAVDLVVVDGPSILAAAESVVLAASVDWTLVVVATGGTSTDSLRDAAGRLARARAKVIGTVLNRASTSQFAERMKGYVAAPGARARAAVGDDRSLL